MRLDWSGAAVLGAILLSTLAPMDVRAQDATHVLNYTPPQNVFRQAIDPAEDYSFNNANASVQVYQFRPFQGNIQQAFQATLLREWIAVMHREENVANQPTFQKIDIPGADLALAASFAESRVGLARPHMRILIIAGKDAALVDASAGTVQSWQQVVPALNQMASTMRVEAASAPAALTGAAGNAVAGLYMGMKPKYTATMQNVVGYASYQNALHFYLFSADGRVYRAYDRLEVPRGAISRFDFDAAERRDPMNSGRYTVDNGKLIIKMHGSPQETIATDAPKGGKVTINAVTYDRQ
jgi:hypothetical protein